MPEYLDDPSVLTKDKLKSELLAHNVELPSGNPTKDVYVQLYLKNLTANNKKHVTAATLDVFSSDEELPPPVVSNRSRSSGRKATRKTDKVLPDEMDVTMLTDEGLKDELLKHGVNVGPIVASTRKLYEKKLQRLLDDGPAQLLQPKLVLTEINVNHNGNSESDLYSDKEDEVTAEPEPEPVAEPEPEPEPEPVPVLERPLRSRGKTAITTRTHSGQHHTLKVEELGLSLPKPSENSSLKPVTLLNTALLEEDSLACTTQSPRPAAKLSGPSSPLVQLTKVSPVTFSPMCNISPIKRQEYHWSLSDQFGSKSSVARVEKIAASEQTQKVEENEVLKELFSNDINSPTGITATCRRPIKGAARRPVMSSDLWNDENRLFSPKATKTTSSSSYTESCTVNRVTSLPPSTSSITTSTSSSRLLSAAPPAGQTKASYCSVSLWIKLFLLAIVAAFLFLVYQAMETNTINPFTAPDTEVAAGSTA